MTIEEEIQEFYVKMCQAHKIDFLRLKNKGHKGGMRGAYSKAVFDEGVDNNKYFPDLMFCLNGKIYMREFGESGSHKDRKEKQARRMHHWNENGNVNILVVESITLAKTDMEVILKNG